MLDYPLKFNFVEQHQEVNHFDLPGVISIARENIRAAHLEDRVSFVVGDYHQDDLPEGCDLVLLSAVIHSNSPAQNLRLFQKIYQALAEEGVVLIRDHIMDPSRTQPAGGALFALNMLVGTPGGDTYTLAEVTDGLTQAGFAAVSLIASGERMDCLVEASVVGQKPEALITESCLPFLLETRIGVKSRQQPFIFHQKE